MFSKAATLIFQGRAKTIFQICPNLSFNQEASYKP